MAQERESSPTPELPSESAVRPSAGTLPLPAEEETPKGPPRGRIPGEAYTAMPDFSQPAPRRWNYLVAALVAAAAVGMIFLLR